MVVLQNGGRAEISNGHLVVSRPAKFDDEGRHVPAKDHEATVRIKLSDIKDVSFVRAVRLGDAGAVVVKLVDSELVLRVLEADGLKLVAACREPVRHVKDTDAGSANDKE